jgi:nucleotide-binding universal stress UspA family protein
MSFKDIVVFLDASQACEKRVVTAIALAKRFDARLKGVDLRNESALDGLWMDRPVSLQDWFEASGREARVETMYLFSHGDLASKDLYVHYADLFVASQVHFQSPNVRDESIHEDILLNAGIPGIILPSEWNGGALGSNIMIAWNASREATRAVHDALPLLTTANKVTVFTHDRVKAAMDSDLEALLDHLARHGVIATVDHWLDDGQTSLIAAIFALLDRNGTDLIVAGAYGKSRMFEGVFGGVTKDLLSQPSMPVLLSH